MQVDEPPKPDDPLLKCDRLILTPHSATATSETYIRSAKTVAQNVLDMFDGRLPDSHVFNPEVTEDELQASHAHAGRHPAPHELRGSLTPLSQAGMTAGTRRRQ